MNDLNNDDFVTAVVNEYSDTIYRVALNITKNRADAFDVCQEVFIRLIKNKHKIKDRSHLKAWLLRVAVNCAKSCKTAAYVRHCVPLAEAREQGVSDNTFDKAIFQFVMQLPPKYSVAIYLFYYEDLKISEISKILNVTQSTVKSRLARGRKQLREIIEREQSYD